MMTGGRELSRQQLSHYNESLFSRVEDATTGASHVTTGEASHVTIGEASHEQSHADADHEVDE
jgi:hypothetical protein